MVTMKQTMEEIEIAAIEELARQVSKFGKKLRDGTTDPDEFITMNDIENNWQGLRKATENVYEEMVSEMIAAVNERGVVRKKKENTESAE